MLLFQGSEEGSKPSSSTTTVPRPKKPRHLPVTEASKWVRVPSVPPSNKSAPIFYAWLGYDFLKVVNSDRRRVGVPQYRFRLTAGRQFLNLSIGVRIPEPVPQDRGAGSEGLSSGVR